MSKRKLFFLLFILYCSIHLLGREYAIYYPVNDSLKIGITGAPFISYYSEVGFGLGLSIISYEKSIKKRDFYKQDFFLRLSADITEEGEFELSIKNSTPIRKYKQNLTSLLEYKKRTIKYYGKDQNPSNKEEINFFPTIYKFICNWERQIVPRIRLGIVCDISGYKNFVNKNLNNIDQSIITNEIYKETVSLSTPFSISKNSDFYLTQYLYDKTSFFRVVGLGPSILYNSKEPNNFPLKGFYYHNHVLFYNKLIYSDYNFITINQDIQYYISWNSHTIASQIISQNTFKDCPLDYYPSQGGSTFMRGLKINRFIDDHLFGIQSEYRSPIFFWRLSMVGFTSTAISYKSMDDFYISNVNVTYGFGGRFALDKSERINARVDIGFSKEGYQLYLKFGEAF